MASRAQRAAARRNIKKAQAANRAKGRSRPKKSRAKKAVYSHKTKAFHRRQNKAMFPEAGKWTRTARILDILTTPVQHALRIGRKGKDIVTQVKNDALGIRPDGTFDPTQGAIDTWEGMATGFIRDKIRSKLGVYRGMAKGKLLSYVIGLSPEIVASSQVDPLSDTWGWNEVRVEADRGYGLSSGSFSLSNGNLKGSATLDLVAYVGQKLAEKTPLNREISKMTDGLLKL